MNSRSFWIAFLSGLTAGSIIALLYAPQTGKDARKKIGRAYDDASDYVDETGHYVKDQAERLSKEAQSSYKKNAKDLDDAYAKATDSLTSAYADAKDKLASLADAALDQVDAVAKKGRSLV